MRRLVLAAVVAAVAMLATVLTVLVVGPSGDDDPTATPRRSQPVPLEQPVETASGKVRGITDGVLDAWLGLPYAAPPVGALRWRAPQAPAPWDDVRDAGTFGATCTQPRSYTFGDPTLTQRPGSGEDCLYLNVERPAGADDRRLPVVVYLHGGGFFAGSGNGAAADAHALVERGIVLVTVNYRLGRLGFFAHPALKGRVGNFGLLDQEAALRWVRRNVASFGGDPGNVTLAGASAGAMSVDALMAMPSARGLFQRAIVASAPSDARAQSLRGARTRGEEAFPGLSAEQLRALPADRLLSSTFNTLSGDAPIVDAVLPQTSAAAFAAGDETPVPYLTGTTLEEFSDADYRAFGVDPVALRRTLGGPDHAAVLAAYGDDYDNQVLDDLIFVLPTVERAVTHGRRAPSFRYVFGSSRYSGHGAENDFVLDTVTGGRDGRLSDAVADYWVAFARTGRPVVDGLPAWPEASGGGYLALVPDGPTPSDAEPRLRRLGVLRTAVS